MAKPIKSIIEIGGSILNKVLPALGITDPEKQREAELRLKELVQSGQLAEEELAIERMQVELSDRADARRMQRETESWVAPLIAVLSFLGFFATVALLAFYEVPEGSALIFNVLVATLQAIVFSIIGFYFGSSIGTKNREAMLDRAFREGERKKHGSLS